VEVETQGPAEILVRSICDHSHHLVHNRPGMLVRDHSGDVVWSPVRIDQLLRRGTIKVAPKMGDELTGENHRVLGVYQAPGIVNEIAGRLYQNIADVWKLDQEFVARWASWAYAQDSRDQKVLLTAFMLVQNRCGAAVCEGDTVLFHDDDYREVGEAMCLLSTDHALSPKALLRVGQLLRVPEVVEINRTLGFGTSPRNIMGRWPKVVTKWLRYREQNPAMLHGLVRAGYRTTVQSLARMVGYRPVNESFFEVLRWEQKQSQDGRRTLALGQTYRGDSWEGLSEAEVCERIVRDRPSYKQIVGKLGKQGLGAAVMAAAIEAGALSDADFVILTPTLEDLGLLGDEQIKKRWQQALDRANNQRAANVARRVRSTETREKLDKAADDAAAKAIAEVTRNLRVYCCIDKSGSMQSCLDQAKWYVTKFLGAFPLDRLHVSVFNTWGTELSIRAPTRAAVEHALASHSAGGGTNYAAGLNTLVERNYHGKSDEDVLCLFIGDEADGDSSRLVEVARRLNPVAFGLLPVVDQGWGRGAVVRSAAASLGIPCFEINQQMFESDDPYVVTNTFRNLIANTPVSTTPTTRPARRSLVQQILDTPLLAKPAWA